MKSFNLLSDASANVNSERESKIKKFTGLDRCVKCVTKEIRCVVDISVIEKWECDVAAGKKFSKAPAGAACDECHAKKHKCLLPRTEQLRQGFMDRKKRSDTVARDLPETKRLQAVEEGWVEFVVNKGAEFVEMVREHEEVEKEITLKHARIADALERVIVAIEEDKPYISPVEWTSSGSEED